MSYFSTRFPKTENNFESAGAWPVHARAMFGLGSNRWPM